MFIEAIKKGFTNCFDFQSRATRSELWYYYLFAELLTLCAIMVDGLLGLSVRTFSILIDSQTIEFNIGPILIIAFFLTGTDTTLPVYIWSQFRFPKKLPTTMALGTILIFVSLILLSISEYFRRRSKILENSVYDEELGNIINAKKD